MKPEPTVPEQDKGAKESSDVPSPQPDEQPTSGGDEAVIHSNQVISQHRIL